MSKKVKNYKDNPVNLKVTDEMYEDIKELMVVHNKKSISSMVRYLLEKEINKTLNK